MLIFFAYFQQTDARFSGPFVQTQIHQGSPLKGHCCPQNSSFQARRLWLWIQAHLGRMSLTMIVFDFLFGDRRVLLGCQCLRLLNFIVWTPLNAPSVDPSPCWSLEYFGRATFQYLQGDFQTPVLRRILQPCTCVLEAWLGRFTINQTSQLHYPASESTLCFQSLSQKATDVV